MRLQAFHKLASIVGCDVRLATESECYSLFPDCEPGAMPPFGELYGLPVYLDETLADDPEIVFSVGTHSDAIRMSDADFVHLAKPQICSFADGRSGSISSVIPTNLAFSFAGRKPGLPFPSGTAFLSASGSALAAIVAGQVANAFTCRSASLWPGKLGWF